MVIIFDIDGTLLGGETQDWASFDRALSTVLGFVPSPEFFIRSEIIELAAAKAGRPAEEAITFVKRSEPRWNPSEYNCKSAIRQSSTLRYGCA